MEGEKRSPRGRRASLPSKDIAPLLEGWDYEPGALNVRKIVGVDGRPKLQMRLDLGLLQMELNGRPDGRRPRGHESLLAYFEAQLEDHRRRTGGDAGFHLTPADCQALREEAVMYYHRYLSLFVLEEFQGVLRDTARNLRVLDLCAQFAVDNHDRLVLEQYRPYLLMMNARARASLCWKAGDLDAALRAARRGLRRIREFFERINRPDAYKRCQEARALWAFAREIKKLLPVDPVQQLRSQLQRAVREERYEDAAQLRDQLEQIKPGLGKA